VFDSGLGGLSVLRAIRVALPGAAVVYAADNAGFPYGDLDAGALTERVVGLFEGLVDTHRPAAAVIACNTASTLVLPRLRARFAIPFVGTVPAIKPAAAATRSGLVSVLATPATVARDYTQALIREFAAGIDVTLVGAPRLAGIAETLLAGGGVPAGAVEAEIAAAFVRRNGRRTDTVVLACTHYPLILETMKAAAPWPVDWLDPAPAIARRLAEVAGNGISGSAGAGESAHAVFTAPAAVPAAVRSVLAGEGLAFAGGFGDGV
jgi:glutamate racemase